MMGARAEGQVVRGTEADIEDLVLLMARDNPRWGYTRIRGALHNLGHEIARNTIKRILLENGFDPVERRGMSWETFLKVHYLLRVLEDSLLAMNFSLIVSRLDLLGDPPG